MAPGMWPSAYSFGSRTSMSRIDPSAQSLFQFVGRNVFDFIQRGGHNFSRVLFRLGSEQCKRYAVAVCSFLLFHNPICRFFSWPATMVSAAARSAGALALKNGSNGSVGHSA